MDLDSYMRQKTGANWNEQKEDTAVQEVEEEVDQEAESRPDAGSGWMTLDQVDGLLELPRPIIKAKCQNEEFESVQKGQTLLISSEDVKEYREENFSE